MLAVLTRGQYGRTAVLAISTSQHVSSWYVCGYQAAWLIFFKRSLLTSHNVGRMRPDWGLVCRTGGFSEDDLRRNGNRLLAGGEGGSMKSSSWGPCCESHLLSARWDPARAASNLKSLFSQMLLIVCLTWLVLQLLFWDKQPWDLLCISMDSLNNVFKQQGLTSVENLGSHIDNAKHALRKLKYVQCSSLCL